MFTMEALLNKSETAFLRFSTSTADLLSATIVYEHSSMLDFKGDNYLFVLDIDTGNGCGDSQDNIRLLVDGLRLAQC
jgi:hypothetical protein